MEKELSDQLKKCLKILDENIDVLSQLELDLEQEKEDEIIPDMKLHHLYDMTEDLAESTKLKRAESNFFKRKTGDFY